eukprot:1359052-Pyramimonas_sp.AAC.1
MEAMVSLILMARAMHIRGGPVFTHWVRKLPPCLFPRRMRWVPLGWGHLPWSLRWRSRWAHWSKSTVAVAGAAVIACNGPHCRLDRAWDCQAAG